MKAAGSPFFRPLFLRAAFLICAFISAASLADSPAHQLDAAYAEYETLTAEGQFKEALPHAQAAYALGRDLFGPDSVEYATLTFNYGKNLQRTRGDDAVAVLEEALALHERLFGEQAVELIDPLLTLADAHGLWKEQQERALRKRALKISQSAYGKESVIHARYQYEAAVAQLGRHIDSKDAQAWLRDAHSIFAAELGPEHPRTGLAAFHRGKLEMARKRYRRAVEFFEEALTTFEEPDRPSNRLEMGTHAFLVEAYEHMGRSEEATRHCQAIGRMKSQSPDQEWEALFVVAPVYPRSALMGNKQGAVDLSLTVDEFGQVREAEIVSNSSESREIGKAALQAISQWRFAPRFENGEPVATQIEQRMTFEFSTRP